MGRGRDRAATSPSVHPATAHAIPPHITHDTHDILVGAGRPGLTLATPLTSSPGRLALVLPRNGVGGWGMDNRRGGMTGVCAGNAVGLISRSSRPCVTPNWRGWVGHGRDGAVKMPSVHPAPIRANPPLRMGGGFGGGFAFFDQANAFHGRQIPGNPFFHCHQIHIQPQIGINDGLGSCFKGG